MTPPRPPCPSLAPTAGLTTRTSRQLRQDRMLKHCSLLSLDTSGHSMLSLLSPELPSLQRSPLRATLPNRLSSSVDNILKDLPLPTTAIKVYAACLRPHLSYKTVVITPNTTSKQVILGLLGRFRMRHRDPNLFQLTMEVTVELGARQTILLEDNSRPAEMISCNPWSGCKFILQAKQGGLVRVYDQLVRPESVYKCLIISEETTVGDTIGILRSCYREEEGSGVGELQLWAGSEDGQTERELGVGERPLVLLEAELQGEPRFFLRRADRRGAGSLRQGSQIEGSLKQRFLWSMLGQGRLPHTCWTREDGQSEAESELDTSTSSSTSASSEAMSTSSTDSSLLVLTDGFFT